MRLFFVGDLYFNPSKVNKEMELGSHLMDIVGESDLFCANLEGVMTESERTRKYPNKKGPCIKQDEERIERFIKKICCESDVNILLTEANNHIMDYNYEGLQYTNQQLKKYASRLNVIGAGDYEEAYRPFVFEKENIRVGIISVAETGYGVIKSRLDQYGYAWFLHDNAVENIIDLKEKCDFVIVVCHAGLEEVDIPLPEVRKVYRGFVDAGADVVIGHHPHVIQGKESYKDGLIFYSLGNFMFDENDGEYNGRSIGVKISIDKIVKVEEIPLLYKNGIVDCDRSTKDVFDRVCHKLHDEKYIDLITNICETFYLEIYRGYYCNVHGLENPLHNLGIVVSSLLAKKPLFDESWLYHNLEIETHRWTVLRGLEQHMRKGEK